MEFSASAPCKAILFGEHYVVYGSPALSIPVEPRNTVRFAGSGEANSGMSLHSIYGVGMISPGGKYSGPDELLIFEEVAANVFAGARMPDCRAEFVPAWKLKGVGISASFCAAFAAGLFRLAGKKAGPEELFLAAQAGDLVAHGGRASGIDAKTVSYGRPLVFQRSFDPPAFNASPSGFALPTGTALLLIDTNAGTKDSTGRMVGIFAKEFGISGTPQEAGGEKRAEVREEYAQLWGRISTAMKGAGARTLGGLMDENHALLQEIGVSCPELDALVAAARSAGALGAKLSGGGRGGNMIALVTDEMAPQVADTLRAAGAVNVIVTRVETGA